MNPTPSEPAWDDPRITAYVLGELTDKQRRRLERQMVDDPQWAAAVQEARQIIDRVSESLDAELSFSLSSDRREAIMETQLSESSPASRPPRPPWVPLALAASLLFLLGMASGMALPRWFAPARFLASADSEATALPDATPHPLQDSSGTEAAAQRPQGIQLGRLAYEESHPEAAVSAPIVIKEDASEGKPGGMAAGYGGYADVEIKEFAREGNPGRMAGGYGGYAVSLDAAGLQGTPAPGEPIVTQAFSASGPASPAPADGTKLSLGKQAAVAGGMERDAVIAEGRYTDLSTLNRLHIMPADEGRGPGMAGDRYESITDNPFQRVGDHPLSTFSIDVDTASYAKVRSYLLEQNMLPRPDAVRIEELVNYFDYAYPPPAEDDEHPFASHVEIAACPWNGEHRLARVAIKGREIEREARPAGNFVFLLDVSGSMDQPNKLPLVKKGMQLLLEQLNDQDRIAIVVYAGAAGLVLDSTPGDRRAEIHAALERLKAGGSTNGGDGIRLAYNVARDHFIADGANRVILCTDGDFNVGTTGTDTLVRMVEEEAKGNIYLSVLGFGMGNHNDAMLEQISGRGNGNYAFIDTESEAHKVLVQQASGTLVTIAKDVKIQVEFNPAKVAAYRLIGYENRILAKEDFNDDTKDAGEIGAGHTVTALYELVPAGKQPEPVAPEVDPLRYQVPSVLTEIAETDEVLTLKLRYKQPDGDTSTLVQFPAADDGAGFGAASPDLQFAAAVAGFGMQLRQSPYQGKWSYAAIEETAQSAIGDDPHGLRAEFLRLVKAAAALQ